MHSCQSQSRTEITCLRTVLQSWTPQGPAPLRGLLGVLPRRLRGAALGRRRSAARAGSLVAESARAHSYILELGGRENLSILAVNVLAANVLAVNRPLSLYIVSKSVFCTLKSVKNVLLTLYKASFTRSPCFSRSLPEQARLTLRGASMSLRERAVDMIVTCSKHGGSWSAG